MLRKQAIVATQGAKLLRIHMFKSLAVSNTMPATNRDTYSLNPAPAVIVVRADQYPVWLAYAKAMDRLGIMRMIFLQSQQAQAQRFLDCWMGAQTLIAQRTPAETTVP